MIYSPKVLNNLLLHLAPSHSIQKIFTLWSCRGEHVGELLFIFLIGRKVFGHAQDSKQVFDFSDFLWSPCSSLNGVSVSHCSIVTTFQSKHAWGSDFKNMADVNEDDTDSGQ